MPHPKTTINTTLIPKNSTASFQWSNWLSPKVPQPQQRRQRLTVPSNNGRNRQTSDNSDDYDGYDSSPSRSPRPRRASFDHMATHSPPPVGRLNNEQGGGGESYFVSLRSNFGKSSSIENYANEVSKSASGMETYSEDIMSLVTMSRSAETDDGLIDPNNNSSSPSTNAKNNLSRRSHSLLTAFLLHLNSLLPEYCDHLSTTTNSYDDNNSIVGASEAIALLERGGKTISIAFGNRANNNNNNNGAGTGNSSPQCSPTRPIALRCYSNQGIPSSAPSSPSHLLGSTTTTIKNYLTPPKSDSAGGSGINIGSPTKFKLPPDLTNWLRPLSPRSSSKSLRSNSQQDVSNHNPMSPNNNKRMHMPKNNKRSNKKYSGMKWHSIAESEWDRFVSPFLMLVGAECLYGKMEHVLDPKKISSRNNIGGAESSLSVPKDHRDIIPSSAGFRKDVKFATQPGNGGLGERTNKNIAMNNDTASEYFIHHHGTDSTPTAVAEANKRGSRRLIAMYRQIREDLIIVGEYLCDPVLGARPSSSSGGINNNGSSKRGSRSRSSSVSAPPSRMPPPPLHLDSRSSSPMKNSCGINNNNNQRSAKSSDESSHAQADPNIDNAGKYTTYVQRELAAISMRHALDALVCFIDARCVLVRVHAELCCVSSSMEVQQSSPLHSSVDVGGGGNGASCSGGQNQDVPSGGRGNRKWIALAEQCRSVLGPVSAWAKERGWRVISNLEMELKVMELALTSIHYLFECDLFHCVLNARRLHVLLGKNSQGLPMMYIRSSLPQVLSMMHVYFADASSALDVLGSNGRLSSSTIRPLQSSGQTSNRKSLVKLDDASTNKSTLAKSKFTDYNSLFAEFIAKHENGLPLAVVVVRRAGGRRNSSLEKRQGGGEEDDENRTEPVSSWEPLFVKSNVNYDNEESMGHGLDEKNSIFKRGQGPSLVRIIRENFSTDREADDSKRSDTDVENNNGAKERGMRPRWPFNEWSQIEKALTKQSSSTETTDVEKHCIETFDAKTFVSNNDINGKIQRQSSTSKQSRVLSHCHVSSITDSICLIVIQGVGNVKRQRALDDDILLFMRTMVCKLCPENLLSIKIVMRLKSDLLDVQENGLPQPREDSKTSTPADNNNMPTTSLWSDSSWSDSQRKKVLHSLGLRQKDSPVMAPLKSPYVRRQISGKLGRHRKKKMKNSINHAHLDFFLGPELSRLL